MDDKKRSGRQKQRNFSGGKHKIQDGGAHGLPSKEVNNASERKLTANSTKIDIHEAFQDVQEGFILIDIAVLCEFISRIARDCPQCGNSI